MDRNTIQYLYLESRNILENEYQATDLVNKIYKPRRFPTINNTAINLLNNIYNTIIISNSKDENVKIKILFQGVKYKHIIETISNNYRIILWGDLAYAFKNSFEYMPVFVPPYFSALNVKDPSLNQVTKIQKIIKNYMDFVKKLLIKSSPDIIVLRTDSFPADRMLIMVAKELGIPTINIQDGIYQSNLSLIHGRAADYVFVWGNHFRDLYIKQDIKSGNKIKVLGYPYEVMQDSSSHLSFNPNIGTRNFIVYYFGQNFEAYNKDLLDIKVETINSLNELCESLCLKFIYRPHPGDDLTLLRKKTFNVEFTPKNETLEESINKGDIFVSFNSTALVEASLRSKLTIQLMNYPVDSDNFEIMGVATKSFVKIDDIKSYFESLSNTGNISKFYKSFNKEYIEIPPHGPGHRFSELINEII